jgi:hypothetical protein
VKILITDIDDTILVFGDAFQKWAVDVKGYTLLQDVRNGGSIQDALGIDIETMTQLVIEFSENPELFSTLEPEPDALIVIPEIYLMGYQLVAISSCVNSPEVVTGRRKNLEDAFGVPWLDVHCTGLLQPKESYLKLFQPTWWVEDNAGHALAGAKMGHTALLLDRPYNRKIELTSSNPTRVNNWYDVLDIIRRGEQDAA